MKIIDKKYYPSVSVGLQQMVGTTIKEDEHKSVYDMENRIQIKSIHNFKAIHFGYFKAISRLSE